MLARYRRRPDHVIYHSTICPVTGLPAQPQAGTMLLPVPNEPYVLINVGAVDTKAMEEIISNPKYYADVAWDDVLRQRMPLEDTASLAS